MVTITKGEMTMAEMNTKAMIFICVWQCHGESGVRVEFR